MFMQITRLSVLQPKTGLIHQEKVLKGFGAL